MKGRYGVIVWSALVCLIGLSWVASMPHVSGIVVGHIVLMTGSLLLAIVGTRPDARPRAPAILAFVASVPTAAMSVMSLGSFIPTVHLLGASLVLVLVGSLATSLAALAVVIMRPAPPRPVHPFPSARVVERMPQATP